MRKAFSTSSLFSLLAAAASTEPLAGHPGEVRRIPPDLRMDFAKGGKDFKQLQNHLKGHLSVAQFLRELFLSSAGVPANNCHLRSTLFLCQNHGRGLRRQLGWCHQANPDFAFSPSVTAPAPARLNGLQTTAQWWQPPARGDSFQQFSPF